VTGGYLYKTADAGATFTQSANGFLSPTSGPYAIQFTDALHGWLAGLSGVYKTTDGGATLETLLPAILADIQFFDNNTGYIMASNKIYATTDAGTTLNQLCSIHKANLVEIHFTDIDHGWTTGSGGYVYRYVKP